MVWFAVFATIGIGVLIHFETINIHAIQERFTGKQISDIQDLSAGRSDFFIAAINGIIKRPVFGYGNFPGTAGMVTSAELGVEASIHNIFLELWLRLGIIGLVLFFTIIFRASQGLLPAIKSRIKDKNDLILTIPIISMFVVLFAGLGLSWEWSDLMWYLIGISLSSSLLLKYKSQKN